MFGMENPAMSSVASLYNVPSTQDELNDWSFAHAANHRDINRIIYQRLKLELPEFVTEGADPAVTVPTDTVAAAFQLQLVQVYAVGEATNAS